MSIYRIYSIYSINSPLPLDIASTVSAPVGSEHLLGSPLFPCDQLFLQIFQRHPFSLRHHFPDKKQLEHHHQREESEDGTAAELTGEVGEVAGHERRKDPVCAAAQGVAEGANFVREYFRDEDPDHCALPDGVGGYEYKKQ